MAKRRLCNYANASNETARDGAIYQRGQYYIIENNNRRGDRRRYAAYLNDDLIGFGGSLVRVKRFINDMYKDYPFETEVNEGLEKVKRFARRAQMTLRTELKPSRTDTGRKSGRRTSPGTARKKSAGKSAAAKPTTPQTMSAKERNFVSKQIDRAKTPANINAVIVFVEKFKQTPAVRRLLQEAMSKREDISKREQPPERFNEAVKTNRRPQQGRLFFED